MPSSTPPFDPVPTSPYHGSIPTHDTKGLPGFPAVDIMAPGGTTIVAPESGTIYAVSGHNLREGVSDGDIFGLSEYLQGVSGKRYYFTHLERVADPAWHGDGYSSRMINVVAGQPIGSIAHWPGNEGRSHLHFGVSGGNAALIASTQPPRETLQAAVNARVKKETGGGFFSFLPHIPGPDELPGAGAVGHAIGGAAGHIPGVKQIQSITDAIGWIFDTRNILRVLEILGGFVLVIVGVYLLAKQSGAPTPKIPLPARG